MKNVLLSLLLLASSLPIVAQTKQPRTVPAFAQIHVRNGITVRLRQGSPAAVEVDAKPGEQAQLTTEVADGTLTIAWKRNTGQSTMRRSATVYVTAPHLTDIAAGNGSQVRSDTPIQAETLAIEATAGSRLTLDIEATTLNTTASGGATLTLTGRAEHHILSVAGGASAHTFGLQSTRAEATTSGGASAELSATQDLAATASSGSNIRYKGAARLSRSEASSGGSVKKVD